MRTWRDEIRTKYRQTWQTNQRRDDPDRERRIEEHALRIRAVKEWDLEAQS